MLHASTSPFYPLFAALDVNAKIHEGESGRRLWAECVALGIEARKAIIANCKMIQPFIPPVVAGRPWQDHPTKPSPASGASLALSRRALARL
jgi:ornithine decarboxylase